MAISVNRIQPGQVANFISDCVRLIASSVTCCDYQSKGCPRQNNDNLGTYWPIKASTGGIKCSSVYFYYRTRRAVNSKHPRAAVTRRVPRLRIECVQRSGHYITSNARAVSARLERPPPSALIYVFCIYGLFTQRALVRCITLNLERDIRAALLWKSVNLKSPSEQ